MKIVIKIGTQAILTPEGTLLESAIVRLVSQIASLQQAGHHIILVSSGAVATGRRAARELLGREYGTSTGEKQVLASLGQHELMAFYAKLFTPHKILTAQLLLTKQDFQTRHHYLNIARLLTEILDHKNIIPVINENDSVAIEELMFTDNDELSGMIAAQINADKLIILTSVSGVYDKSPTAKDAKLIALIDPEQAGWPEVSADKSLHGRGGMLTKLGIARKMSQLGIATHIAKADEPDVIIQIVNGVPLGTQILPLKKQSNIKKWLAVSDWQKSGAVTINDCLYQLLQNNQKAMSILPVGIEKVVGDFKKGDLIEILAPDGKSIGVGMARYGNDKLQDYLQQKDKPEFIHYDHLHIYRRK